MADGPKNGGGNVLSSYIGRWMSFVMLGLLLALVAGALFFKPDYPAHVPLRVGVCAFDSVAAGPALNSLATTVREQDGGDITWVWLGPEGEPAGCDFYMMTSLQMLAAREKRDMECILLSTARVDGSSSMGAVITLDGVEPDWSRTAFTSSASATGFLSPLAAIVENGIQLSEISFETLSEGCPVCGDAVAFGVLHGIYGAGGIPLEELRRLERNGTIMQGALRVLFTGPGFPEIVLVSDPSTEEWKSRGFAGRLPRITGRLGGSLSREMARLGMVSFRPPAEGELELAGSVPEDVLEAAGYHFP